MINETEEQRKLRMDNEWHTCKKCGHDDRVCKKDWNWVMNGLCRECDKKITNKIDFDSACEDGYVTRDDSIMCPYCGYVEDEVWEMHDSHSFTCPECNKESDLSVEYTPHFTTSKREKQ